MVGGGEEGLWEDPTDLSLLSFLKNEIKKKRQCKEVLGFRDYGRNGRRRMKMDALGFHGRNGGGGSTRVFEWGRRR